MDICGEKARRRENACDASMPSFSKAEEKSKVY